MTKHPMFFRAIRPLKPEDLVRGQYEGYRDEVGVSKDSDVETLLRDAFVH